jgi:hypothetical protein
MPKTSNPYIVTVVTDMGNQVQTYHPHETSALERIKETLRYPDMKTALITRDWSRPDDDVARTGDDLLRKFEDAEEEAIHEATNGEDE